MGKKTFNEKLADSKDMPKVIETGDPGSLKRYGGSKMLIAPPLEYDGIMKRVPAGKLVATDKIRAYLAEKYGANITCPLTAGIFINIAAMASEERSGMDETPYWRTLRSGGELNEKYPGGIDAQKLRLTAEGHNIIQKGKRYFVEDYEKALFPL